MKHNIWHFLERPYTFAYTQYTIYQILSGFMCEYVHTCDSVSDSFGDDVILQNELKRCWAMFTLRYILNIFYNYFIHLMIPICQNAF